MDTTINTCSINCFAGFGYLKKGKVRDRIENTYFDLFEGKKKALKEDFSGAFQITDPNTDSNTNINNFLRNKFKDLEYPPVENFFPHHYFKNQQDAVDFFSMPLERIIRAEKKDRRVFDGMKLSKINDEHLSKTKLTSKLIKEELKQNALFSFDHVFDEMKKKGSISKIKFK
jgi:hypothetical protein